MRLHYSPTNIIAGYDLFTVINWENPPDHKAARNMPNELNHLLAQCDPAILLDDTDRAWLNAKPVGHEMLNEHFDVQVISDSECFIDQLRESLAAIDSLGQPREIADLTNEIRLLLGRAISDKAVLERDFMQGFAHGVDLAHSEDVSD